MANSTSIHQYRGWVTEPNGRGTMGLLWSCLSVIFICCWSVIHPNVPGPKDSDRHVLGRKITYAVGCLVAPEFFVLNSAGQWLASNRVLKKIEKIIKAEGRKESDEVEFTTPWTKSHAWLIVMGGFAIKNSEGDIRSVDDISFLKLISQKVVVLPTITEAEIDEKSKGNAFVKGIAAIQILYLAIELLGRAIQRLAVSTLELFTLAMVIMALFVYFFWWSKPLDVRLPIILEPRSNDEESKRTLEKTYEDLLNKGNRVSLGDGSGTNYELVVAMVAVALFGACHIIAWDFDFLTSVEHTLWRVASIGCMVLPLLVFALVAYLPESRLYWCMLVLGTLYSIVRLYLIVEVFIGLRRVPAGVYQTVQWSQFFPHV